VAVVVVCLAEDDPSALLSTLGFADEVHLVTDSSATAEAVSGPGRRMHVITRPSCIEEIGQLLLTVSASDWILLVDPDERVRVDGDRLYHMLGCSDSAIAAFEVEYTLSLFGVDLAETFRGLRKTKLLRSGRCVWPSEIHALPRPTNPADRIESLDGATICVASDLADDLLRRFTRHAQWASIEASDRAAPVDVDRLLASLAGPLTHYLGDRQGLEDGSAGLANALLHAAKEIQSALFEISQRGLLEMSPADRRRADSLLKAARDL
jgi:hypothetical protein